MALRPSRPVSKYHRRAKNGVGERLLIGIYADQTGAVRLSASIPETEVPKLLKALVTEMDKEKGSWFGRLFRKKGQNGSSPAPTE